MAASAPTSSVCERALELAKSAENESVSALADVVRIRSLTGEEAAGQAHMVRLLRELDAEVLIAEPDTAAMFERYPAIAQYPTHWQHDLILPYEVLPTYADLLPDQAQLCAELSTNVQTSPAYSAARAVDDRSFSTDTSIP